MPIDWKNLFKVRLASSDNSMQKHEIVKLLLVMKLINKHKKIKNWIRIYTEFDLGEKKSDVYFENIRTKECHAFEIQKNISTKWLKETRESYDKLEFNNFDFLWHVIPLDKLSNDITKLNKELDKYLI